MVCLVGILTVYPDILNIPILKSGDSIISSNYRPISNIYVFNKVFEKLIHLRLSEFLANNNFISEMQFGFRRISYTTLAVFHLVTDLLKSFHYKNYCICLFQDICKAFNTVNVEIIAEKLKI